MLLVGKGLSRGTCHVNSEEIRTMATPHRHHSVHAATRNTHLHTQIYIVTEHFIFPRPSIDSIFNFFIYKISEEIFFSFSFSFIKIDTSCKIPYVYYKLLASLQLCIATEARQIDHQCSSILEGNINESPLSERCNKYSSANA